MRIARNCKNVSVQVGEELLKRAKKAGARDRISLAELVRRALHDLVTRMEKGEKLSRSRRPNFDGDAKNRR